MSGHKNTTVAGETAGAVAAPAAWSPHLAAAALANKTKARGDNFREIYDALLSAYERGRLDQRDGREPA